MIAFAACVRATAADASMASVTRSFFLGQAVGLASFVPGGFGSSDVYWIAHLTLARSSAAAALMAYRLVYYVIPWAAAHQTGVIAYSPMGSGLLTGKMTRERLAKLPDNDWRKSDPTFQEPELSRNLALVDRLQMIAKLHGTTPGAVAIGWTPCA